MASNVSTILSQKFQYGLMPKIRRIMNEEGSKMVKALRTKANNGGLWAYDYNNNYNQHSISYWNKDIVRDRDKVKLVIWNDKPLRNYYNYIAKIKNEDLSDQVSSDDIKQEILAMKNTIRDRIKYETGGK